MRVLVVSAAFPPMMAPEADHALHLCRGLADRGMDVHVLTTIGVVRSENRATVYPVMREWSWAELPRLVKCIKHCSPDGVLLLYLGWVYKHHPMVTFVATITKAVRPSARFVTQFEHVEGSPRERWSVSTRLVRKAVKIWAGESAPDSEFGTLLRDSDRILVLSENHRKHLAALCHQVNDKSVLVPVPPVLQVSEDSSSSRQRGRQALGLEAGHFAFAYFGYIYPTKGIETLLEAFQIISCNRTDLRLLMIGGTPVETERFGASYVRTMHDLSKQLGIEGAVRWSGSYAWDSDEASVYLRAADVCVLPLVGGLNLNNSSFAAAAFHGLPVVATEPPKLEPLFRDRENVYLCPHKSPEALASAMIAVLEQPDLRERLRAGALKLAREWFTWEEATTRTVAALSEDSQRAMSDLRATSRSVSRA